jgi:hypothetical protein
MGKSDTAFGRNVEIYDTTIGWRFINKVLQKKYGIDSMPKTAENVAEQFDIDRKSQDEFALRSQLPAASCQLPAASIRCAKQWNIRRRDCSCAYLAAQTRRPGDRA